jgi:ribosome-binding protein aMBF1 (putative translation factor)
MNEIPNAPASEIEALEDQVDGLFARLARIETANDEFIPWEMHKRLSGGESAVRVWREHRGLSLRKLSEAARTPEQQLVVLEAGGAEPGLRVMARIARALGLEVDDLVPPEFDDIAAE